MKANVLKKIEGVKKLPDMYGNDRAHQIVQYSREKCSTYSQYKKQQSKDPGMLKDLDEWCAQCVKQMSCPSPTSFANASNNDEDEDRVGEIKFDVVDVEGLIDFASQAGG